jgi:hypothetical protein
MDDKKNPINKRLNKLFNGFQYEEPDTEPGKNDEEVTGQGESESSETNSQVSEILLGKSEAQASDLNAQGDESIIPTDASTETSVESPEAGKDISPEDLLDEVRHVLIEVQEAEDEKPNWWRRMVKGPRKKKEVVTPPPAELDLPGESASLDMAEQDEYVEQLDELIDMLEDASHAKTPEEQVSAVHLNEVIPEDEQEGREVVDVEELKKRAFSARKTPEEEERSLSEVRSIALDDGEEVFVEVEAKAENPMQDRVKAIENSLRPYRNYFYFVVVFIGLVVIAILSMSIYRLYLQSLPPPPVEEVAALPYPVAVNLPGGLKFNLGKGSLDEGRWDPRGPEWLEGTEVCRWIAIPYSEQMEAVVLTLKRDDKIELIMSNNDVLIYNVDSRDRLSIEEMLVLDSNSPCMLLVLAQSGSDERWVVTAIP